MMMMMTGRVWSVVVMVWCSVVVSVVWSAPADSSHHLTAEHKSHPTSTTPHPIEDILDAMLHSETVSAIDSAAATLTTAMGEVIDDLGDFMVDRVKDLPQTIQQVSERVSQAVSEGGERVVIVVKGVRGGLQNQTATAGSTVVNSMDRVVTAANSSQTLASLQELQERVAVSLTRIFGSLFVNLDKIDSAMAHSIRRISGDDPSEAPATPPHHHHHQTAAAPQYPTRDNEIKVIS